jgi:hypothetical protein
MPEREGCPAREALKKIARVGVVFDAKGTSSKRVNDIAREALAASCRCFTEAELEQVREALIHISGEESLLAGLMDKSVVETLGPDIKFRASVARERAAVALALLASKGSDA